MQWNTMPQTRRIFNRRGLKQRRQNATSADAAAVQSIAFFRAVKHESYEPAFVNGGPGPASIGVARGENAISQERRQRLLPFIQLVPIHHGREPKSVF